MEIKKGSLVLVKKGDEIGFGLVKGPWSGEEPDVFGVKVCFGFSQPRIILVRQREMTLLAQADEVDSLEEALKTQNVVVLFSILAELNRLSRKVRALSHQLHRSRGGGQRYSASL